MRVCVLGSINLDIVCTVAELPRPGETISAFGLERFPGGKGANQAVASARWGAQTALIGAVGADEAGEGLLAHLREAGVDTTMIARIADRPTGQAFINVSAAGENAIVVVGGANRAVTAEDIAGLGLMAANLVDDAQVRSLPPLAGEVPPMGGKGEARPTGVAADSPSTASRSPSPASGGGERAGGSASKSAATPTHAVFLAQLETPLAAIEALFASEAARNGVKILNAAPALDEARALFPLTDILIVNETELARYAGLAETPETPDDVAVAARGLISRRGQTVVATLGEHGAAIVTCDGFTAIPGRAARVVDTTGAGDCFCGVLAASVSEGVELSEAVARANAAASLSTERAGAAVSATLRAEVEAL